MKKRILAVILTVCMAAAMMPTMAFAANEDIFTTDGIRYRIIDETAATVEVIHPTTEEQLNPPKSSYSGDITIPAAVEYNSKNYTVIGIAPFAFIDAEISSITLNEGLQYIDGAAFAGSALKSITIPASVIRLGGGKNSTSVFSPNSNDPCVLEELTFAEGSQLKEICVSGTDGAFKNCDSLQTVQIPAGVTDLYLGQIVVTPGQKYLGIFNGWDNAKNVTFADGSPFENVDGILYGGDTLIAALDEQITSVTVREGTTEIGDSAFYMCTELADIVLPEGLETIGDDAFNYAPNVDLILPPIPGLPPAAGSEPANAVTRINIPSTVTSVGTNFLKGGLKDDGSSVVVMQGPQPPTFGTGVFASASSSSPYQVRIYYPAVAEAAYTDTNYALASYINSNTSSDPDTEITFDLPLSNTAVTVGNTATVTATVPEGATLTVSSNEESIVTVSQVNGVITITGVAAGTTEITASITLNSVTLAETTCTVTVSNPVVVNPTYTITNPTVTGGTVTVSPRSASRGRLVTITVTPDEGYELASLTVTDSRGSTVTLSDAGNGKYTFTMPGSRVVVNASFQLESLPFTDVAEGAWYYDAIAYVYRNGLMAGVSSTQFAPDSTLNRATLATILWRLAGEPVVNYVLPFEDVAEGEWYSEAVRWAASTGIVNGTTPTTFRPFNSVTREQMAAMVHRYAEYMDYDTTATTDLDTFTDAASVNSYAAEPMGWCVAEGLISGIGTEIRPQSSATRAQIATMLMRLGEDIAE